MIAAVKRGRHRIRHLDERAGANAPLVSLSNTRRVSHNRSEARPDPYMSSAGVLFFTAAATVDIVPGPPSNARQTDGVRR